MGNLIDLLSLSKEDVFEIFHIADKIQEGKLWIWQMKMPF